MNITPGTLCLVVGAVQCTDNLGKTVIASRVVKDGDIMPSGNTFRLNPNVKNLEHWLVEGKT